VVIFCINESISLIIPSYEGMIEFFQFLIFTNASIVFITAMINHVFISVIWGFPECFGTD